MDILDELKSMKEKIEILIKQQEERACEVQSSCEDDYKPVFWQPKEGDEFLHINDWFGVVKTKWEMFDSKIDEANCYPMNQLEVAKLDAEKAGARQIIQRTADHLHGFRMGLDHESESFAISYLYNESRFSVYKTTSVIRDCIYFASKAMAEECLSRCTKEFEILFGVDKPQGIEE